jgi:hypothetical protein
MATTKISKMSPEGKMVNNWIDQNEDVLCTLYSRWLDESGYEDISEYGEALQMRMAPELKIRKMNKRPWGPEVEVYDKLFQIRVTTREISWRRIG